MRPPTYSASFSVKFHFTPNVKLCPLRRGTGRSTRIMVSTIVCGRPAPDLSVTDLILNPPSKVFAASNCFMRSKGSRSPTGSPLAVRLARLSGVNRFASSCSQRYSSASGEWLW